MELHNFKAQPLPELSEVEFFRKPPRKPVTVASTPKTLIRSRLSDDLFQKQLQQERLVTAARSQFIASELPETTFTPQKLQQPPVRSPTIPSTPDLHTDSRALDRRAFETELRSKQFLKEKEIETANELEKKRQAAELRAYRKTLIHKARPLPLFCRRYHDIVIAED